jgi:hypothetical protein
MLYPKLSLPGRSSAKALSFLTNLCDVLLSESLTATILADGRVQVGRDKFDSISNAGGAARATVIGLRPDGRHPPTNGWTFWRMQGPAGKAVPVDDARQRYLAKRGNQAAG